MTIQKRFGAIYATTILLLLLLMGSVIWIMQTLTQVYTSQEVRYKSYLLADELRQSSDDLTRLARTYAVTGDPKYEKMYWDVLAIRNGEQPRPEHYERIYWDLVAGDSQKPRPDGARVPLRTLMPQLGFTEQELAKLQEAQKNSDALVWTETVVMNAVKGLFDDGTGKFVVKREPDMEMARRLMHDQTYHNEKAKIMKPIDEFFQMLDERTNATVQRRTQHSNMLLAITVALNGALIVFAMVSFVIIQRRVSRPIRQVMHTARQVVDTDLQLLTSEMDALAQGDLSRAVTVSTTPLETRSRDEIGQMAQTFNAMIARLQDASRAFGEMTRVLRTMVAEAKRLTRMAVEGKLTTRGSTDQLQGGYKDIIQGVNATLDAVMEPLNEAAQVLEKLAVRDLTARMQGGYQGDFATIKTALNTAVANLERSLSQVAVGAEQVTAAAGQINTGSQALAQGASEQASTLQEVSSSLQELSSMSQQNAANAQEARSLADNARHSADTGTANMQRLSQAIDEIKKASDETAKIVKTIDEIAFQTNLLALNAAVEAARAGDAGKGFAVVAEEVRNLAMRSAEAAKTTAQLIEEAVRKAEDGVTLNREVLGNLGEIVTQVHKVSEVMGEIAAASEQQQQGVQQLNIAVGQLNQVTQQTAANSEEAASTAEELSSQAVEMRHLVGAFQLSGVATGSPRVLQTPVAQPQGQQAQAVHLLPRPAPLAKALTGISTQRGPGHAAPVVPEEIIPFNDDDAKVLRDF
jgi:methyl-accepting chemotaxis protein